jgi:hypothetical protein
MALAEDLKSSKHSLDEFKKLTIDVLRYLPLVISHSDRKSGYIIYSTVAAGTTKYIRPIKEELFLDKDGDFESFYEECIDIFSKLKSGERVFGPDSYSVIDKVIYTIQQSIGAGLDLFVDSNSAKKHVGNRFEELIRAIVSELNVANKKVVLKIPYDTDEGIKMYSCETDLVFSPYQNVLSTSRQIDQREVVVSLKSTSKDRMGKIFIDKILLERFVGGNVKHIGIFLNDVQRKSIDNISFTFVPGLFLVYTKFLAKMDGVYFIDLPPKAKTKPYNNYIFPFSKFIIEDIWILTNP